MNAFKRWAALASLMLLASWYLVDTGVVEEIMCTDVSKLSVVIAALLAIGTVLMGYSSYRVGVNAGQSHNRDIRLYMGWFMAEAMMVLGLAGTVVGFIVLFQGNFAGVTFDDPETVQEVIIAIASGMGVALYTTIVGIFSSLLMKIMLVNVEVSEEEQDN